MSASPQEIASLIERFDPSVNPRYKASLRKVYKSRDSWFGKETTIYEVAWRENIGFTYPIADPMDFTIDKSLDPCFWVTDDHKLLKRYKHKFAPITLDRIYHASLDTLYLGLTGDFARIDEKFAERCRQLTAEQINRAIKQEQKRRIAEHPKQLRRQILDALLELDSTTPEYQEAQRKLIAQMLR